MSNSISVIDLSSTKNVILFDFGNVMIFLETRQQASIVSCVKNEY